MNKKIQKIIERSKEIIRDASLDNGAIVAGNSDMEYYPHQAKDYRYVWPRDSAYICVSASMVGINDIQEPFYKWLLDRPEDFRKESLLYANYSPNGRKRVYQFQPDQAGAVLWSIHDFYKNRPSDCMKQELLIRRLADGLAHQWKGSYFFKNTVDLWEEGHRRTSTKMENNHTYSLAACARGLKLANEMINNAEWEKAANEIIERINGAYDKKRKRFLRNHGKISDPNIDSSLLGLAYPFEIVKADDPRMINTADAIEKHLVEEGGVHRYQFDYYDGEGTAEEGGGAWPILNFWLSIYFSLRGDRKKAEKYFDWVVDRIEDDLLIPEQIFLDFRKGIKPLVWSHSMFIIASRHLGYIK